MKTMKKRKDIFEIEMSNAQVEEAFVVFYRAVEDVVRKLRPSIKKKDVWKPTNTILLSFVVGQVRGQGLHPKTIAKTIDIAMSLKKR